LNMKLVSRLLQKRRIAASRPSIDGRGRVLDIGCGNGALLRVLSDRIAEGVGIDPLTVCQSDSRLRFVKGFFPEALHDNRPFDCVVGLAVLEHIPEAEKPEFASACRRLTKPGGRLILTVPSPKVDRIVGFLKALGVVDGTGLDEHHHFDPKLTRALFEEAGFELVKARRFELGLNHLFVFRRSVSESADGYATSSEAPPAGSRGPTRAA
jgi:SAM-dependent methyltransferase